MRWEVECSYIFPQIQPAAWLFFILSKRFQVVSRGTAQTGPRSAVQSIKWPPMEWPQGNKQVPSKIMEERAKYFPSESIIKKSILSQSYSRGDKCY